MESTLDNYITKIEDDFVRWLSGQPEEVMAMPAETLVKIYQDRRSAENNARLLAAMPSLAMRVKTTVQLAASAAFYISNEPIDLDEKALATKTRWSMWLIGQLAEELNEIDDWSECVLEVAVRKFAATHCDTLGEVTQPLRAALTGSTISPPIFEVMRILGRPKTVRRMWNYGGPMCWREWSDD